MWLFRESVDSGCVGVIWGVAGCQETFLIERVEAGFEGARPPRSPIVVQFRCRLGIRSPMSQGSQQFFHVQTQAEDHAIRDPLFRFSAQRVDSGVVELIHYQWCVSAAPQHEWRRAVTFQTHRSMSATRNPHQARQEGE